MNLSKLISFQRIGQTSFSWSGNLFRYSSTTCSRSFSCKKKIINACDMITGVVTDGVSIANSVLTRFLDVCKLSSRHFISFSKKLTH